MSSGGTQNAIVAVVGNKVRLATYPHPLPCLQPTYLIRDDILV